MYLNAIGFIRRSCFLKTLKVLMILILLTSSLWAADSMAPQTISGGGGHSASGSVGLVGAVGFYAAGGDSPQGQRMQSGWIQAVSAEAWSLVNKAHQLWMDYSEFIER